MYVGGEIQDFELHMRNYSCGNKLVFSECQLKMLNKNLFVTYIRCPNTYKYNFSILYTYTQSFKCNLGL